MKTLPALALFLAIPASGPVFASTLAESLSGIERIMWERDARSIPALRAQAAGDPDEKVRARAVGALTLLRDTGAPTVYLERLSSDPSPRVRRAAADAIGTLGITSGPIDQLTGPLQKDKDPMVRAECARALGKIGSRNAAGALMYAVSADPSPEVRSLAVEALSRLRVREAEAVLSSSARQDRSPVVRAKAVNALAEISPASSRVLFEEVWKETTDPDVRFEAYQALVRSAHGSRWIEVGMGDAEVPIRFLALRSWFSGLASSVRQGFHPSRTSAEIARLERFLKDPARGIREFSREALENLGYRIRPEGFAYTIDDR